MSGGGVERVHLSRPRIDPGLVLRLHGYRQPGRVPAVVREAARRMASLAETLVDPQAWIRHAPVRPGRAADTVLVAGDLPFHSRVLARLLGGAREAVLVVLTVGPGLEGRAERLVREEQYAEGVLLDTAGWVAIEALMKDLRARLRTDAAGRRLRLTGRMAPGFADWPLEEQRILFAAFAEGGVTVRLTDACVMLPRKSISGIFGLVPRVPA